jgi:hypothetical protein
MTRIPAAFPKNLEPAGQWVHQAACLGRRDDMFPDNSETGIANAKRICKPCPVWRECLADAIRTGDNEHGIRGGLKPCERRDLARKMALDAGEPAVEEPSAARTLETLWGENTAAGDGHLAWTGGNPVYLNNRVYTPKRVAFWVDRGRVPIGSVRATCRVDGCVLPAHLTDRREREQQREAERLAAERAEAQRMAAAS